MLSKKEIVDREIGNKLAKLRTDRRPKLTQDKLYVELRNIIAKREGTVPEEENVNGDKVISKIENGYGLSLRYALAYSEFFNVSLEYLYFDKKSYKPEYDDMKKMLGFSDYSLNKLEELNKNNKNAIDTLNKLLSPNIAPIFIELLDSLFEHSSVDIKARVSQYPGNTFLNEQNKKGYYKKPIMLKPKDLEYQSLFTISEISKNIANELKKNGGK